MPAFDFTLPPKAYSTWWPKQPLHPFVAAYRLIARWIERTRQREALAQLDDHTLRDIGITRFDALREAEKPFWK